MYDPAVQTTLVAAIREALHDAMAADDRVIVLGEDVGALGGVFRATDQLLAAFGPDRVRDMPLNEGGIVGAAIGMALVGQRPVVEIQFADFVYPAFDQIVNELAKLRWRSAGQWSAPVVVRMPVGGGVGGGPYHSQSPEAFFAHVPGLRVMCPSTPADAYGLLRAAVECPDPVIFLEPKRLYRSARGPLPPTDARPELVGVMQRRAGKDVTVACWGGLVPMCLSAAERAAVDGVDVEILDLARLIPMDRIGLSNHVRRTGRLVVAHEAPLTGGLAAEVIASLDRDAFFSLQAPPERVCGADVPVPYRHEEHALPSEDDVHAAITRVMTA